MLFVGYSADLTLTKPCRNPPRPLSARAADTPMQTHMPLPEKGLAKRWAHHDIARCADVSREAETIIAFAVGHHKLVEKTKKYCFFIK